MASSQPTPDQQPKVYLRNSVYSTNGADDIHAPSYGQAPVSYRAGDTTVYVRQPPAVQRPPYSTTDTGGMPFYTDELTTGTGTYNEISSESKGRHSRSNQRPHHHHHHQNQRRQRVEEPDGYWILPHESKHAKAHSTTAGAYVTPGGRRLPRTPKKHTAGLQVLGTEQTQMAGSEQDELTSDLTQDLEEYMQTSQYLPSEDSEMTITFHYNPTGDLETAFDNDMLVRLQAQCRAYLAKLGKRRRLREDDAVRTIQKNAALYFDPWFRLFLVLKPHLKRHRLEEEIIQLKSELEKFKAMVKVLRYENVAYQDKISRLLMLLDQMQPGGTSGDLVSKLVKELSLAVADHQKQWRAMISGIRADGLNGVANGISPIPDGNHVEKDLDPITESSYQMAKENAEFYRNQLELLREEVDDQNARTSQHYEEKIGVLSERVEQLQNMLTQESFRVERLNGELEAANSQLAEARETEDNLTSMVDDLRAELARRRLPSASDTGTPGEPMIVAKNIDNAFAAAPLPTSIEGLQDKLPDQISAQKKLMGIRNYLAENPDVYETLKDTPLGQGGEYDIFSATDRLGSNSYGLDGTLGHSMNSVFHSQSHIENYHLGRAHEIENRNDILQQKLEEEIGYREDLELEAQELRNKISNLQRQVRRQRDEHEEEMVERDQAHIRRVRELDDVIDELSREKQSLEKRCLELQKKVEELRQEPDLSDSENVADNLRDTHAMLVADNRQYLKELDQIREEFEQYKRENNTAELKEQLAERDERISQLEVSQRHTSSDMEILNVRLQNANKLLDDNEQRLRGLTKERQTLLHRISQLESERDSAVREAASAVGKAGAEREAAAARQRELDDLKHERHAYQKELTDMKVTLTETSTKALTEKQALEKRLSDLEAAATKREADLKGDLDTYKEKVDTLQQELSALQKVESATSTDNRHLKRQIRDLQDSVDSYTRKVAELERRNSDLSAELDRAKSNLSATRETATLLRDRQTRANEEYAASVGYMDDVAYSDDEVGLGGGEGDTTSSMHDIFRRSSGSYAGFSGTQTVDRHRNRSKQRQYERPSSRSSMYNRSQPKLDLSSTLPRFGSHHQFLPPSTTSKDASPQPPVSKPEAADHQPEWPYDSEI